MVLPLVYLQLSMANFKTLFLMSFFFSLPYSCALHCWQHLGCCAHSCWLCSGRPGGDSAHCLPGGPAQEVGSVPISVRWGRRGTCVRISILAYYLGYRGLAFTVICRWRKYCDENYFNSVSNCTEQFLWRLLTYAYSTTSIGCGNLRLPFPHLVQGGMIKFPT